MGIPVHTCLSLIHLKQHADDPCDGTHGGVQHVAVLGSLLKGNKSTVKMYLKKLLSVAVTYTLLKIPFTGKRKTYDSES